MPAIYVVWRKDMRIIKNNMDIIIGGVFFTALGFVFGIQPGLNTGLEEGTRSARQEAIDHGYMRYNRYTGEPEWIRDSREREAIDEKG